MDGDEVPVIHSNLGSGSDVTLGRRLSGQSNLWCYGSQEKADFGLSLDEALEMLHSPNSTGLPNSDVLMPSIGGRKILQRATDDWVIDFGDVREIAVVAGYELPFERVKKTIYLQRAIHREPRQKQFWWLHARPSPEYRKVLKSLPRYLVTPASSKHRVFVWRDASVLVDHAAIVFGRDDDFFFGVMHSRVHENWARAPGIGTQVRERESGFRYTPKSCFEPFPFPQPSQEQRDAIAEAVRELDRLRTNWLNPPEWTREEVLEFPGSVDGRWARYVSHPNLLGIGTVRYPRLVPKDDACAKKLAKRTLTNLYNERPTWLDLAHQRLDEAVVAAYGWDVGLTDDDLLAKLLELNLERAACEGNS